MHWTTLNVKETTVVLCSVAHPDPEFLPAYLDTDPELALIVDSCPVLAYKNPYLTIFGKTIILKYN